MSKVLGTNQCYNLMKNGAGTKIRTRGLMITNQLLYQLSYTGIVAFNFTADG